MRMTSNWTNPNAAGLLPVIFDAEARVTAREQIEMNYAHGGGFCSMLGDGDWTFTNGGPNMASLHYPGEPKFIEQSRCELPLTGETVILFDDSLVVIVAKDGSFDITRMD